AYTSGRPGPTRYGSVTGVLNKVSASIGLRHVHPHMLRHTFASHAVMRGVPIRVLQSWLGHAAIKMTLVYAHLAEAVHADFIDRIAAPRGLRAVENPRHTDGTGNEKTLTPVAGEG